MRPNDNVNMVRHDDPSAEFVALAIEELERASDDVRAVGAAQVAVAVPGIEVAVHAG